MFMTKRGMTILGVIFSRIRIFIRLLFGGIFNLAGIPGLVRDCNYRSVTANAEITVRQGELFTIISVNGLDIYFHRLTGSIDGVGSTSNCKLDEIRELAELPSSNEYEHHIVQK